MTKKHDDKLSHVGVVMSQQQDRVDERFKSIEGEITAVDIGVSRPALRCRRRAHGPAAAHRNLPGNWGPRRS